MAAMSRGPVAELRGPKMRKGGTPSSRKHHFEPFSQRITKLKIEPVRRGRSTILDDAELDSTFSYFKNGLDEWRDINISANFTNFARQISPLCDSLPQVLHHSGRILELLVEYIEKGDQYSEEPLLSLMAHFAHDLGVRFESYFEQAVRTVSRLAAKHPDVEVIEWSFTCLAWLFKYLSRLLVSDLRPVFDLMAPLLGREHQKPFVTRFAAESLSFLVRKAGAAHHRDRKPLQLIIKHISEQLKDLQGSGKDQEFQRGLMSLFADSMTGVQRGFHSSAPAILEELLVQVYHDDYAQLQTSPLEPTLLGVVTSLIHHSDADNFEPIVDTIIAQITAKVQDQRFTNVSSHLLFIVCGVRKGSRVANWKPILESLSQLVEVTSKITNLDVYGQDLLSTIAISFQYCSMDTAIPHVQLLESLSRGPWEQHFLPFSNLFAQLGQERFNALLLPYFKRFVTQKAHEHGPELCVVLPQLYSTGTLPKSTINPSGRWQEIMIESFQQLGKASDDTQRRKSYDCNAILDVVSGLSLASNTKDQIINSLYDMLTKAVDIQRFVSNPPENFVLAAGHGFQFLVRDEACQHSLLEMWPALCEASTTYGHFLPFWRALLSLADKRQTSLDLNGPHKEALRRSLIRCLGCPSHEMRLAALSILEIIVKPNNDLKTVVSTAMMIEDTPPNLENQRAITMRMGHLAKMYVPVSSDEWLGEAIPTFCFGLLHVRLASVWEDACSTLKVICQTKEGENHVAQIALEWLKGPDTPASTFSEAGEEATPPRRYATEFECTNVMQLADIIANTRAITGDLEHHVKVLFHRQHAEIPHIVFYSREQALRVLNALPHVAEKRSRLLTPVLLDWALDQQLTPSLEDETFTRRKPEEIVNGNANSSEESENQVEDNPIMTESLEQPTNRWTRKDQKAMLSVFSKFVNPRVLFRATEVREGLLALLRNGDVEIQKSALKALLAWKEAAIVTYQEELHNLLDEARFRDEIPELLSESKIDNDHKDVVMPVILRLLYGRVISGNKDLQSKRRTAFSTIVRFGATAIRQFLSIALGPLDGITVVKDGVVVEEVLHENLMTTRKQVGMLNMLGAMLDTLKATLTPFTAAIIDPLLYCLFRASRELQLATTAIGDPEKNSRPQTSTLRTVRQRSLHALTILFESCPEFSWISYTGPIVKESVNPRLEHFPIETAHSVSGLLRLFAAWSSSLETAPFLVEYNSDIMIKVMECLNVPSAKNEVQQFVLDNIVRRLVSLVADLDSSVSTEVKVQQNRIHSEVLQPNANVILHQIGELLRKSPSKEILESGVSAVAELAPHIAGSAECRTMIEIATFLLEQPTKRVSPRTKHGLLQILCEFIPRCDGNDLEERFESIFQAVCSLFAFFRDRPSRGLLCDILQELSDYHDDMATVAGLCHDLNAYSISRLDEPDFDRRSKAYYTVTEEQYQSFSIKQWSPLVYNMLYYIKDTEELSTRASSSLALRRFIEVSPKRDEFKMFISAAILPAIQNGMRESSELVRVEFLTVLAQLVKDFPDWDAIADLHVLLSEEEESSFFNNILHIQGHRRLRALRRLAILAPQLQAGNVYHMLIPLLEHFIFDKAPDESANNLAGESIKCISALGESLQWPQFRSLFKRFISYLTSKEDVQKTIVKLLGGMMESLNRSGRTKGYTTGGANGSLTMSPRPDEAEDVMDVDKPMSALANSLPQQDKLTSDITKNLLPDLITFLHNKDEATVSLRVPVAVAVTKVLLVLPPVEMEMRLPAVLIDICQILKSRAQESRDMSRNTLSEIAKLTGPAYLGFILKALRTSLQRGYQLHVMSFTLHHILVNMADRLAPGDLDYCLGDIIDVIMDDIFGITGQEKEAEEYTSKMREVKSSKSYDTVDIISRSATPSHLAQIVQPIKSLLLERLNAKAVRKIDELLRRIGLGVLQNPTVKDRDILVFCYELIQEVYKANATSNQTPQVDLKNKRYLVNMKGAAKSGSRQSASSYVFKITRFSLDILRTVLKKHEDLQTPQNLAGFLPIIGDAMVQGQEEVQTSAVRILTTIIKVPMAQLDRDCPVHLAEAVQAIEEAPSSNTELAQASLKLISAVLRERPNVEVREKDLAKLLKRVLPDLDQPDRQGVTFGFLKAVMNRGIIVTEIYEVMDKVAEMMITNQTRSTRDVARSHYIHFLIAYPKKTVRFKKQIEFMLKNLQYTHVEGRSSVMEALNLVITKLEIISLAPNADEDQKQVQQDVLTMMFLPLVNTVANDDSSDSRKMAGELIKVLFKKMVELRFSQRLKSLTDDMREWLEHEDDAGIMGLGIRCWGLYIEAVDAKPKEVSYVLMHLQSTIENCLERRDEEDWELIFYSLNSFSKICKRLPDVAFSSAKQELWTVIDSCVLYPHAWVKLEAVRLIGMFFADLASTNGDGALDALPLEGSRELQLSEERMIQLTNAFLRCLNTPNVSEDLCIQCVRNLAFLARCLAVNGAKWNWQKVDDNDEAEDADAEDMSVENTNGITNGHAESSDEEFSGFSPLPEASKAKQQQQQQRGPPQTAIHRLMIRLSSIIRRDTKIILLASLWPKSATMTLVHTLTSKLPIEALTSSLPHLLTTLTVLADATTTHPRAVDPQFNDTYKSLIDKAHEILSTLQKRMGTQEYLRIMGDVQKSVKQRREERRRKRKVEAVTMPEKHGREKKRKNEVAKRKKKERSAEIRTRRRGW